MSEPQSKPPGWRLLELVEVMDRLRSPGGCAWDAEQTHKTLVEYLVEEAYETIDAIDSGDRAALREELGDLLLQVVFHSRIAQEDPHAPWGIDEVAAGISDKLIARHPHVFGDGVAHDAADVEAQWQARKAAEKGRTSVTDGVPIGMPSLVLAPKLLNRARVGGVDVAAAPAADIAAAEQLLANFDQSQGPASEQLGDLLLALTSVATARGLDVDAAMRSAVARLRTRIEATEATSP